MTKTKTTIELPEVHDYSLLTNDEDEIQLIGGKINYAILETLKDIEAGKFSTGTEQAKNNKFTDAINGRLYEIDRAHPLKGVRDTEVMETIFIIFYPLGWRLDNGEMNPIYLKS